MAGGDITEVERLQSPTLQLAHAARLRRAVRKVRGEARVAARETAAEAYEAVAEYHPKASLECAEALFRAAELRRTQDRHERACELFERAARASRVSPFRVRSWLELGHVQRRQGQYPEALSSYEKAIRERSGAARYRDLGLFWKARVVLELGREPEARRILRELTEAAEDPVLRIRGYDELVLLAIDTGDLEWAAGVLEQCRQALAGPLAQETHVGRRVRSAFRRMRCRKRLRDAVEKRNTPSTGCAVTPFRFVPTRVRSVRRISA
jgi:tetratricopeptide (TPR) repeat protein